MNLLLQYSYRNAIENAEFFVAGPFMKRAALCKFFVLSMLILAFFGVIGLVVLAAMQWVTRRSFGQNSGSKQGIGHEDASRLGGAVIGAGIVLGILSAIYTGSAALESGSYLWGWVAIGLCGLLGLIEDFDNNLLSPKFRLACISGIFGLLFIKVPELIPSQFNYAPIDAFMAQPTLSIFITVLFSLGFINAVNMSDGANGLVPGITFIAFAIFSRVATDFAWVWVIAMFVLGVFLVFNVFSGRLFLGDGGAYLLGSILLLGSFNFFNGGIIGPWFLAVLFAYPCIEMVVSLVRRLYEGRSPFLPDNDHFHNRLHRFLQSRVNSRVMANSGTGLLIVMSTSGVAGAGYYFDLMSLTDNRWVYVFIAISLCQLVTYAFIGHVDQRFTQHGVKLSKNPMIQGWPVD